MQNWKKAYFPKSASRRYRQNSHKSTGQTVVVVEHLEERVMLTGVDHQDYWDDIDFKEVLNKWTDHIKSVLPESKLNHIVDKFNEVISKIEDKIDELPEPIPQIIEHIQEYLIPALQPEDNTDMEPEDYDDDCDDDEHEQVETEQPEETYQPLLAETNGNDEPPADHHGDLLENIHSEFNEIKEEFHEFFDELKDTKHDYLDELRDKLSSHHDDLDDLFQIPSLNNLKYSFFDHLAFWNGHNQQQA